MCFFKIEIQVIAAVIYAPGLHLTLLTDYYVKNSVICIHFCVLIGCVCIKKDSFMSSYIRKML